MKTAIQLLLCLASIAAVARGGELREELVHGQPIADREKAWEGHISYASWLNEKQIVFWSSKDGLVCLNLESKTAAWTRKSLAHVREWSVSRKSELIAMVVAREAFGKSTILVIDAKTGKPVFEADGKKLARLIKRDYVVLSTAGLSPDGERLLIIDYTGKFERSGFAFNPRNPDKVTTFHVDPSICELSFSPDGKRIAYIAAGTDGGQSDRQILAVRSLDADEDVFLQGKRVLKDPDILTFTIDAPFYSHIRHDGRNLLLYSKDNSWAKGQVFVRDLATGRERSFSGRNGHIELDVHFERKRIALTGTSKNVTVLDFDGKVIAEKKKATADRNVWIEFSPAGDRLLIASWDNTVRVFRIVE